MAAALGQPVPAHAEVRLGAPDETMRKDGRTEPSWAELIEWVESRGGRVGMAVAELDSGMRRGYRADVPGNAASTSKLLTSVGAMLRLGSERRFVARLHGQLGHETASSVVLWSDGDPSLDASVLDELAAQLASLGVRRVLGPIGVDQSCFDGETTPPAFDQQPEEWSGFRAPVSAVAVAKNTVRLELRAGRVGQAARVEFFPEGALLGYSGEVRTVPGEASRVSWQLIPEGRELSARLRGWIGDRAPRVVETRRLADPRLAPARIMAAVLERHGISTAEHVVERAAASLPVLAQHHSEPVGRLVKRLGKDSDNFTAEMLLKAIGAVATGGPGSSAAGAAELERLLATFGRLEPGTQLKNGSGLFRANLLSADALVRVLLFALRHPVLGPNYLEHLAISGVDGTLRRRLSALPPGVRVLGKTGTLRDVNALAGYLVERDRPRAAFAILVEGLGQHAQVRARIDSWVEGVARSEKRPLVGAVPGVRVSEARVPLLSPADTIGFASGSVRAVRVPEAHVPLLQTADTLGFASKQASHLERVGE